jgi:hypothetical protein
MAYTDANWTCISSALNQGQQTVTPFGGSPTVINAPNIFIYGSPNDTVATIIAANYFLSKYAIFKVGDWILGNGTDGSFSVIIATVSATSVTVTSTGLTTAINTADIVDNAVTFAKFQELALHTLVGNPTAGTTEASEVTLGNGLEFSTTTLRVPLTTLQYVAVPISAVEFNGMYAAPKLLIANGGANTLLVLKQAQLLMTYNSAAYAAGGTAAIQYDSTANGAGVIASTTLANTIFQGTVSIGLNLNPGVVTETFSTCVNKGLYLSNISGAYTTGNSAFVMHLWYATIPTV